MNTNQLKRFAREARIKLLDQVSRKLEFVLTQDTAELRGKQAEIKELKQQIDLHGKMQVIDTAAYTWFNRLMALRFMDANGYTIPKVLTPAAGMTLPEILHNAKNGHIEEALNVDRKYINDLLDNRTPSSNPQAEVYRILLVATCNSLHSTMPFMFEPIHDYTELLLPDDLLSEYSIVADIRAGMSDEDCQQEELIGWLYQFYIAQKKDDVFEKLKKNIKITPDNIPAATQLFTPRWIVRYMVENTLGKLWMTLRPDSKLRDHMPYYIESTEGNEPIPLPEDLLTTDTSTPLSTSNTPLTKISFLDPCVGSGHVIVYAFDLLTHIYEEEGYNKNEIPALILQHNLYGIDIDERAAQLAAFALTMKAQSYYNRFLRRPVQPNIIALENIRIEAIEEAVKLPVRVNGKKIDRYPDLSLHLMTEADNFGSLIQIESEEVEALQVKSGSLWQNQQIKLKQQAEYLSRKYHCVVTNPPYMGGKGMNGTLKTFVQKFFPLGKTDLMACFMERCLDFLYPNGKTGMINQQGWMFLSSYEDFRNYLVNNFQFESMLHLGSHTFPEIGGEVVQNTTFVIAKCLSSHTCTFIKLIKFQNSKEKEKAVLDSIGYKNHYLKFHSPQSIFLEIPGKPICYWLSEFAFQNFRNMTLGLAFETCIGLSTGDNDKFIRYWHEVSLRLISFNKENKSWTIYSKGGESNKWYGNKEFVVWFINNGIDIKSLENSVVRNEKYYFRKSIQWSRIGSGKLAVRFNDTYSIFDVNSASLFYNEDKNIERNYILALLNSSVANYYLEIFSPTLTFQVGDVSKIPYIDYSENLNHEFNDIVEEIIKISKNDWDRKENSWDFRRNELINHNMPTIKEALNFTKENWLTSLNVVRINEIKLNEYFIDLYNLNDNLTNSVSAREITLLKEEIIHLESEIALSNSAFIYQLNSYFVGCSLGRYSLDKTGLIIANQGETFQDFLRQVPDPTFMPDRDNVVPVLEDEWFQDDIVTRFKAFLKVAFSEEYLDENIKFIEETIGKDIRKYFVKDFYADHIKRYKKRPIYWMFTSPKGHFKALIYMHRYTPDICSKVLNDYLQPFISKLEAARQTQVSITLREDISARDKTRATKEIDKLDGMLKDCRAYDKTLFEVATRRIEIDLDDGVKVNYQKFKEVLVPIKGLEKDEEG